MNIDTILANRLRSTLLVCTVAASALLLLQVGLGELIPSLSILSLLAAFIISSFALGQRMVPFQAIWVPFLV